MRDVQPNETKIWSIPYLITQPHDRCPSLSPRGPNGDPAMNVSPPFHEPRNHATHVETANTFAAVCMPASLYPP